MVKKKVSNFHRLLYNKPLVIGLATFVVIILLVILEVTNTTQLFHKEKIPVVIPTHTNTASSTDSSKADSPTPSEPNTSTPSSNNTVLPTNRQLVAPSGNFISNHYPVKDGSPTLEASICNTTSGADCFIKFTNTDTGVSTQLPIHVTGADGSTSWYWDVRQDAHLTSGVWRVEAIATLGSQTKSTNDSLNLTIQ